MGKRMPAGRQVLLAAQKRDPVLANAVLQALDPRQKARRFGHAVIEDVAFLVIELVPLGPTAHLATHEQVLDPRPADRLLQLFLVEMRHVPGIGGRTRIDDDLDVVPLQQVEQ